MRRPRPARHAKEDIVLTPTAQAAHSAAPDAAPVTGAADDSSDALLNTIKATLDDSKAEDIVTIDLRGKTEIGDYMVVCSGRSSRQVSAIAERLIDTLKAEEGCASKVEGKSAGDWVLIDTGDVIVHVFRPEVREFYQLEKMWQGSTAPAASAAR